MEIVSCELWVVNCLLNWLYLPFWFWFYNFFLSIVSRNHRSTTNCYYIYMNSKNILKRYKIYELSILFIGWQRPWRKNNKDLEVYGN